MFSRSLLLATGPFVLAAITSASLTAQDAGQAEQEQQTSEEAQDQNANAQQQSQGVAPRRLGQPVNRRTLYFIGPKAQAERQLGPTIGAPKSILPTPFVPRGSLAVPEVGATQQPAPGVETQEAGEALNPLNLDTAHSAQQDQSAGEGLPVIDEQQQTLVPPTEDPQEVLGANADPFSDIFQERSLERLDPSGISVNLGLAAGGVDTVWQGYSRAEITSFLKHITEPTTSPLLSRLASAVAASRLVLPAPEQDSDVVDMINARLAVFEANADVDAYAALIGALPVDRDWSAMARHQARAHLLKGELPDACDVAERQRAVDVNAYWVRLGAFCMAANGDRAGVDFQLGILEETNSLDTTFYQLLDQILIEAEQPAGAVIPQPVVLSAPLRADIVSAAMARLARVQVAEVDVANANLLAMPMLLQNPSLSQQAQTVLIDALLSRGVAGARLLSDAAGSFAIDAAVLSNVLEDQASPEDGLDQLDDAQSEVLLGEPVEKPSDALVQMTLLAAIAQQTDVAEQALGRLWEFAAQKGTAAAIAPALHRLMVTLPSENSLQSENAIPRKNTSADALSVTVRASALTDVQAFNASVLGLRVNAAGADIAKDAALVRLWPLLVMADMPSVENNPDTDADANTVDVQAFERWWRSMNDDEHKYLIANSLLTTLDGFGMIVPDSVWSLIADGPAVFDGRSVSPALWRALQQGGAAGDPVATLKAVYTLHGGVSAKDIPPSVVGALVASLRQVGFNASAKAIAFDILISQGL